MRVVDSRRTFGIRLTYDSATDDEVMEEPDAMDDEGEDGMEDYFGMSPDWYDAVKS